MPDSLYSKHKNVLSDSIRSFIERQVYAYGSKENDSSTEIFIDTILYSPIKDKLAFFVITRNSRDKLFRGAKNEFYFDGCFFLGTIKEGLVVSVEWFHGYTLTRFPSMSDTSKEMRRLYFSDLVELFKNSDGTPYYKYNLGDKRFWGDVNIWSDRLESDVFISP